MVHLDSDGKSGFGETRRQAIGEQQIAYQQPHRSSALIIAYGNVSRRDDGVAFHILQRLRGQLGLAAQELEFDCYRAVEANREERLGMICVHQLAPELAETVLDYDMVIFVDAHVADARWEDVHWQEIAPAYLSSMVAHHLKPASVLALCQSLYGRCPRGYILSVLGVDFDFGEELSPTTSALVDEAVKRLLNVFRAQGII